MSTEKRGGSSEYLKLLGYKRYHYRCWSNPSRRRIVLLHGRGECADIWAASARILSAEAEVIALDLRGHGGTPWDPDLQYGFGDFVEDLRLQLQHWAVKCVLVGHGFGGRLAMAAGAQFPEFLDGIVLVDIDSGRVPSTTLVEQLSRQIESDAAATGAFAGPGWRTIYTDLTWAQPGGGRRPKCDPAVLLTPIEPETDHRPASINIPALVVRGRTSQGVSHAAAKQLANALPMGSYAEVQGAGWPQIDSPIDFAEAVLSFVRSA